MQNPIYIVVNGIIWSVTAAAASQTVGVCGHSGGVFFLGFPCYLSLFSEALETHIFSPSGGDNEVHRIVGGSAKEGILNGKQIEWKGIQVLKERLWNKSK